MRVAVRVVTGSSKSAVRREADGSLKVWVTARPEKGRANEQALCAIAEFFRVPRSEVNLVHGVSSRSKIVVVATSVS